MTNVKQIRSKLKQKKAYDFAFLPRMVVPPDSPIPIAHRHTSKSRNFVTPFEMAVAMSIAATARSVLKDQNHQKSFAYGEKGIQKAIADADEHKEHVVAVDQRRRAGASKKEAPFPPKQEIKRDLAITQYGKRWYWWDSKKRIKAKAPDVIEVTISPYQLLKQAKLKPVNFFAKMSDELFNRLCEPIGKMSPLLLSWERTAENKLFLRVSGRWLDWPYDPVPFPLPVASPAGTALWLFCFAIIKSRAEYSARYDKKVKMGSKDAVTISFEELCRRLGIQRKYNPTLQSKLLNKALTIVNGLLAIGGGSGFAFYPQNGGDRIWIVFGGVNKIEEALPKQKKQKHKPGGPTYREKRVFEKIIEPTPEPEIKITQEILSNLEPTPEPDVTRNIVTPIPQDDREKAGFDLRTMIEAMGGVNSEEDLERVRKRYWMEKRKKAEAERMDKLWQSAAANFAAEQAEALRVNEALKQSKMEDSH